MNGAEALVRTLIAGGVDTCFANPGTSEMHLVAALDRVPGMRCVLCLAEGVVTGAADGYARIAGKPAVTLLHLGPGLGNGIANLHNAKKARTPVLNLVGDHATYHRRYDAPLTSDVEGLARPVSDWVRTATSAEALAQDAAEGLAAARAGAVATLIVPADTAWGEGGSPVGVSLVEAAAPVDAEAIEKAARRLGSGRPAVLMVGGSALREPGLTVAARIAAKTGARLIGPTFAGRAEGGAGRPAVERVPYSVVQAVAALARTEAAVLCGVPAPVAFFAYPGQRSLVLPGNCETVAIAAPGADPLPALLALQAVVGAETALPCLHERRGGAVAPGALTLEALGAALAALLPEGAILVDESISGSFTLLPYLSGAAPHEHLQLTGGAIGIGMPLATGAAVASPRAKVICLEADGSGMYSLQALWTQAREAADVVTVVLANRRYATLYGELAAVGVNRAGENAAAMFDLDRPALDWVALARGMGVDGLRAAESETFAAALADALARPGPFLIEALV